MYHKDFTYRVEAGTAPVALVNAVQPIAGQPNKSFHAGTGPVLTRPVAVATRGTFLVVARVKISKIEKRLVLIILVLVFTHTINIYNYSFV